MRRRYLIVSAAVPVAVGAIIAAYSMRHTSGPSRVPLPANLVHVVSGRAERIFARVSFAHPTHPTIAADVDIVTAAQARSQALAFARSYGTGCSHVVAVERMALGDAINRTRRDPRDEFDLDAACYGESARLAGAWRVQLDDADASSVRTATAPHTAILVLAAGGMLVDMTLGCPVPQ